jgi:hypothetical protein
MISVTIDRTELALTPLVIGTDPANSLYLDEDGLTEPQFEWRTSDAPESVYIPGQLALAAVQDAGGLGLVVYAQAATTATLAIAKAELKAALEQWRPTITTDVDGIETEYEAVYPVTPHWGTTDSGMVRAHLARTSVTVVVNPPTGA